MYTWEGNIKMELENVEWEGMDWIGVAQDTERWQAVVNEAMNFQIHKMRGIS
jgi:hypothetical protein